MTKTINLNEEELFTLKACVSSVLAFENSKNRSQEQIKRLEALKDVLDKATDATVFYYYIYDADSDEPYGSYTESELRQFTNKERERFKDTVDYFLSSPDVSKKEKDKLRQHAKDIDIDPFKDSVERILYFLNKRNFRYVIKIV